MYLFKCRLYVFANKRFICKNSQTYPETVSSWISCHMISLGLAWDVAVNDSVSGLSLVL